MKQGKGLLADNHQNMLEGVRNLLENMFDNVFMVADEASLMEAAEKLKPDLIVADLSPGDDGTEHCEASAYGISPDQAHHSEHPR